MSSRDPLRCMPIMQIVWWKCLIVNMILGNTHTCWIDDSWVPCGAKEVTSHTSCERYLSTKGNRVCDFKSHCYMLHMPGLGVMSLINAFSSLLSLTPTPCLFQNLTCALSSHSSTS